MHAIDGKVHENVSTLEQCEKLYHYVIQKDYDLMTENLTHVVRGMLFLSGKQDHVGGAGQTCSNTSVAVTQSVKQY